MDAGGSSGNRRCVAVSAELVEYGVKQIHISTLTPGENWRGVTI